MTREEAIEIVRNIYQTDAEKEALATLIPELAESEDERIRKALIEVFKEKLERGFEWVEYGIPNRSVLSWLEKQKERGPLTKEEEYNLHRIIWKPSEDQMKWLKDVIETVPMTCRQQVPLESLYADLQKLFAPI